MGVFRVLQRNSRVLAAQQQKKQFSSKYPEEKRRIQVRFRVSRFNDRADLRDRQIGIQGDF